MDEETVKAFFCHGAFLPTGPTFVFNEPALHRAQLPAVNGITNARSLARIFALLISDVDEDGKEQKRLLSDRTLSEATRNVTPQGEVDQNWCQKCTTFSRGGFQTYGECFNMFGDGAFGHVGKNSFYPKEEKSLKSLLNLGYGGSCVFAYPPYQLTFAFVCNYLDPTAFVTDRRVARFLETIEKILHNQSS